MSDTLSVHCDCEAVEISMSGAPKGHAFCHCEDCRDLLQVPYHSVLAWEPEQVSVTKGRSLLTSFQHPSKRMKRVFCQQCAEVMFNTNAMGWKLISQILVLKSNDYQLPTSYQPNRHFFYDRRIVSIDDDLPKQ